jgi:hypothetical protein
MTADYDVTPIDQDDDQTALRSYRYLRLAMVVLLLTLAASVLYQSLRQKSFLSSVSAYYFTPAQGIFVGALIGLGACMIALRGTTPVEDVALNVGGAFAAVVAVVPTSRGQDYRAAVEACTSTGGSLVHADPTGSLDCPTVHALSDATSANVQNNMFALLCAGLIALLVTLIFLRRDDQRTAHRSRPLPSTVWGLGVIGLIWVGGLIGSFGYLGWFVDNGHYLAAFGLLLSVVLVAVVNARRHEYDPNAVTPGLPSHLVKAIKAPQRYAYTWIAIGLLVVTVIAIFMRLANVITLFWLEIAVAALFAAFWTVQTFELD